MDIPLFTLQLIFFLILSVFFFTIPGALLLIKSYNKFSFWEKVVLGTVVGFITFTLLSYVLVLLKLHVLLLPIITIINIFSIKFIRSLKGRFSILPFKSSILLYSIFSIGLFGQLLIISPSGIFKNGNLIFYSSHGHDSLWHISLMNEYEKGLPMRNPSFSGERLVNYHFFSDIAPAEFNRYFKFSPLDLYFRFFPLLYSFLLGSLAYLIGKKLGGNFSSGIWAVIFTYFAGSFGYIVTLMKNGTIGGESLFWASQIQSSTGNPPQIVALIIVLTFLYLFIFFTKYQNKSLLLLCAFIAGALTGFKIYGALILLTSLLLTGLWQLIRERKIHIFAVFLVSGLLSAILYLPNASNTAAFLIFEPWWFIRTLIVAPDRLNLVDWELRRQTYIYHGNWIRVLQIELTGFLIFFFGNLGFRLLGIFSFFSVLKTFFKNYFSMILLLIMTISFLLPLLFLQKGVAANTIQFIQYFLLISGILAGISVAKILLKFRSNISSVLISLLIIIFSVPTQVALIYSFYNRTPITKIDSQELLALDFLKKNVSSDSIILAPPYNKDLNLNDPIPQIWDWFDTSYISALSGKSVYLSDSEQLDIMGYDFKKRLDFSKNVFLEIDPSAFSKQLRETGINYLYFPLPLSPKVILTQTNLQKVFSNTLVEIWEIR